MAPRARRRRARGCRPPSGTLKGGRGQGTPDGFGAVRKLVTGVADDGSRWRGPSESYGFDAVSYGFDAVRQNGSAASELSLRCASLHHGLGPHPPNTRMWHECSCTTRGLPSDFVIPTTTSVPSCSNPSRTKPLRVALRAILDRFCARRLYAIVGRDEETACQVEQRNSERRENG